METNIGQPENGRKEAALEEALKLWMEMKQVDQAKGWKRLEAEFGRKRSRQKFSLRWRRIRWIAALVVLLIGFGGIFWLQSMPDEVEILIAVDSKQPRLILENGEQISLGHQDGEQEKITEENFVIDRKAKNIVYVPSSSGNDTTKKSLSYNILEVPRGAEYELTLADGTHIWLNAETRLRYPVSFGEKERRVYLEGEAYFEVAKDSLHPFRVESATQVVEVLGTQFNVYAYGKEEQEYTTLIEGKVAVTASLSGQQVVLLPGQQVSVLGADGTLEVEEVDIQQIIDWKNGVFVFDNQNLEVILRKVARWYDVAVFYRNSAVKSIIFKGNLPRYGELSELLNVLESSCDVHFSLQENVLIVE